MPTPTLERWTADSHEYVRCPARRSPTRVTRALLYVLAGALCAGAALALLIFGWYAGGGQ